MSPSFASMRYNRIMDVRIVFLLIPSAESRSAITLPLSAAKGITGPAA